MSLARVIVEYGLSTQGTAFAEYGSDAVEISLGRIQESKDRGKLSSIEVRYFWAETEIEEIAKAFPLFQKTEGQYLRGRFVRFSNPTGYHNL